MESKQTTVIEAYDTSFVQKHFIAYLLTPGNFYNYEIMPIDAIA